MKKLIGNEHSINIQKHEKSRWEPNICGYCGYHVVCNVSLVSKPLVRVVILNICKLREKCLYLQIVLKMYDKTII